MGIKVHYDELDDDMLPEKEVYLRFED